MFAKSRLLIVLFVCGLLLLVTSVMLADTTLASSFTYQGNLTNVNGPVNNICDFQFSLFTLISGGSQISSTQSKTNVSVSNGMFNTVLDFGVSAFDGQDRYLQIAVRCPAGSGGYTTLSPRQAVTPAPYAQYAQGAAWSGLSGIPTNLTTLGNLNCATNQIPKWNGTTWACAADNTGTASSFWSLTGNAGTTTSNFIGTTDETPLEFRVNNQFALRIYPFPNAPNIIAGSHWNNIGQLGSSGGNTIGGGGAELGGNTISGSFNTIGGGYDNEIKPENYNTIG
ncbi:MAG: hypothetical protein K8L97_13200, partial [Anaerolineae bacterium]|nr:hypothetical protein [Anaerolineae bacterium]